MTRTLDSQAVLKPAYFAHVVLRVRNVERSVAWYQTAVAMEVVYRNDVIAFLTFDEEHHRLALVQTPVQEPAPPGAAGMDHVAYTFNELGDLLSHYVRLKNEGIKPVWTINHGPTTSMYYEDPDGNRVEFQVDNFETEAELKGWMSTDVFEKNPIGVQYDPDKLVARYEQGDPIEELVKQGSA